MKQQCSCTKLLHKTKLVVLTGGPGAGKTAVLELARKSFCEHVAVLPEAASIVFGGGFWRRESDSARRAAQRAIFHVQAEMERLALEEQKFAVALCDRGTLDGMAYWRGDRDEFFKEMSTIEVKELARYVAVIHLRTPSHDGGYNKSNPVRIESADEAAAIDQRLLAAWENHPKRIIIESSTDFVEKALAALQAIKSELPDCCKSHEIKLG